MKICESDNDILIYLFNKQTLLLAPKYNVIWMDDRFLDFSKNKGVESKGKYKMLFTIEEYRDIAANPTIIHYVIYKPWHKYMTYECSYIPQTHTFITHPYAQLWFNIARRSNFYIEILYFYYKKAFMFKIVNILKNYPRIYRFLRYMKRVVMR